MRRKLTTLAAGAAALTLLAGCGGNGDDTAGGKVTLDYLSLAWQKESIDANKKLVAQFNKEHPNVQVKYVQGSWDNIHDQLLTSFEGGEAPDIIHDEAYDLTDFAYGGYLADMTELLPADLKQDIPKPSWDSVSMNGGVYGVPFLQEPRMMIANTKLLKAAGIRIPTPDKPWTWDEFEDISKKLTKDKNGDGSTDQYGVAWGMNEPVNQSVNLSLSTGGEIFTKDKTDDGVKNKVHYGPDESAVAQLINRQVNKDHTSPKSGLSMKGSDTLPGFFAGRYAMVPLNFSFRQQVAQQAPDDFDWEVLPMPAGKDGITQGVSPQTLSISEDTEHKKAAMDFIAYMSEPDHMAELAKGDWMLPTGKEAMKDPAINREKYGWGAGAAVSKSLKPSPMLGVRGYPEWSDKLATPAYQRFYNGDTDLEGLRKSLVEDGQRVLNRYQR
ncbi:sugar ABC transporter substrate-binding protein [Streptomyces sp. A7024]|uniref:Sugar ABC transporter substrate-binding protein n=1 Tax=Streptomyces coryli TaxID=1128680 RepID=A0A6G4UAT1_9ACTN|nr:sugar ABC transporter substrate-binding protein [Streptomyces coryli]NGN69112.1 sugar ABC transporter substrate-binding protein [Streptomyces coryli]